MSTGVDHSSTADPGAERRSQRRAARLSANRADILDAAEHAFATRGFSDGSLRDIAAQAGFSTAAIYNYFDNKQHLLAETLGRRGTQLLEVIDAAATGPTPVAKLHQIVDATIEFFDTYPDFRRMLRHAREGEGILSAAIEHYVSDGIGHFQQTLALMTSIVEDGQGAGEIRDGSPSALTHLYMTLVYEHLYLVEADDPAGALTHQQFHDLVDGALRRTAR